jgi:hypothetical protein
MSSRLYSILKWAKDKGEMRAVERIRLRVLVASIEEGIALTKVGPETSCSPKYLQAVRDAASAVVGKPCPY